MALQDTLFACHRTRAALLLRARRKSVNTKNTHAMKRSFTFLLTLTISHAAQAQQQVDLSMAPGYANELYYSLEDGLIKAEPANNWDLAFATGAFDASIMINEARGVAVFKASDDINDWSNLDTTGMAQNRLHNSSMSWSLGALANLGTSHPDYGWGTYNVITHDLSGSRVFVLLLSDGSYKKLKIDMMSSMNQEFSFTFADLDGTNEKSKIISKSTYSDKNFVYYDIASETVIDREPESEDWDLVFRKYDLEIPAGPVTTLHYLVTGVQTNLGIGSSEVRGAVVTAADSANYPLTKTDISTIGSDWKSFNMTTFTYDIADSLSFFVSSNEGGVYHLIFTDFSGSSTGDLSFTQSPANAVGTENIEAPSIKMYPNPSSGTTTIALESGHNGWELKLSDLSGKILLAERIPSGAEQWRLELDRLPVGSYQLLLVGDRERHQMRLILTR